MKKRFVTLLMATALTVAMLSGCGGEEAPAPAAESQVETQVEEQAVEEKADEDTSDVEYVDGFYANNGEGSDFMIFFYTTSDGDVAYVNDGTSEAFAVYTVEEAQLDDGTGYLLVTVGNLSLGYYEEGSDIYIITEDGDVYAAGRLSEDEAEALYSVVNS